MRKLLLARLVFVTSFSAVVSTGGCSGGAQNTTPARAEPTPRAATSSDAAIVGDNSSDVLSNAAAAAKAGLHPRYVLIKVAGHSYGFTRFARVVRTKKTISVQGFSRVFVFPRALTSVYYSGNDILESDLPLVSASELDVAVDHYNTRVLSSNCFDCALYIAQRAVVRDVTKDWGEAKDPWQSVRDYQIVYAGATRRPESFYLQPCWFSSLGFTGGAGGGAGCPIFSSGGGGVSVPVPIPGLPGPAPILGSACGSNMVVNPPNPPTTPGQRFVTTLDGQGGLFLTNAVSSWSSNMSVTYYDRAGVALETQSSTKSGGTTSSYQIQYAPYSNASTYYQSRIPFNFYDTEHTSGSGDSQSFALTATARC